jgi:hypothetical protein
LTAALVSVSRNLALKPPKTLKKLLKNLKKTQKTIKNRKKSTEGFLCLLKGVLQWCHLTGSSSSFLGF